VVFTDLDGTLLDHDTYDWQPAAAVLEELKGLEVPVVLVSSKTLPELEEHRQALVLQAPVIAENGAAIDTPAGYFPDDVGEELTSVDRSTLQRHFRELRDNGQYNCVSFEELGDAGIAAATGLTKDEAELANRRKASEPIQWNDTEERLREFAAAAEARGLRCTQGGRFVHLMGPVDKADAVAKLCDAYARKWPDSIIESIALGDGPNDLGMLRMADVAVVIPGGHEHPMPLDGHQQVRLASDPGPTGWASEMRTLIDGWQVPGSNG
jgi:mannosyl-3-phosphoglycerate phosphatase family protein